jgi:hypothetical protein
MSGSFSRSHVEIELQKCQLKEMALRLGDSAAFHPK